MRNTLAVLVCLALVGTASMLFAPAVGYVMWIAGGVLSLLYLFVHWVKAQNEEDRHTQVTRQRRHDPNDRFTYR